MQMNGSSGLQPTAAPSTKHHSNGVQRHITTSPASSCIRTDGQGSAQRISRRPALKLAVGASTPGGPFAAVTFVALGWTVVPGADGGEAGVPPRPRFVMGACAFVVTPAAAAAASLCALMSGTSTGSLHATEPDSVIIRGCEVFLQSPPLSEGWRNRIVQELDDCKDELLAVLKDVWKLDRGSSACEGGVQGQV